MDAKLYAFWKYDSFPFVLGGPVKRINQYGNVEPENYPGMTFSPIRLLPLEDGLKLKETFDSLEGEYRKALVDFNNEFAVKLNRISVNAGLGELQKTKKPTPKKEE